MGDAEGPGWGGLFFISKRTCREPTERPLLLTIKEFLPKDLHGNEENENRGGLPEDSSVIGSTALPEDMGSLPSTTGWSVQLKSSSGCDVSLYWPLWVLHACSAQTSTVKTYTYIK